LQDKSRNAFCNFPPSHLIWLPWLNASQEMVSKKENPSTRLRWILAPNSVLDRAFPRTDGTCMGLIDTHYPVLLMASCFKHRQLLAHTVSE
jgi:hypothetical protein